MPMAGRSAHVRRVSNELRTPERRRSSSQGDATPRVPAPPTIGALLHNLTLPPDRLPSGPGLGLAPLPSPTYLNANSAAVSANAGASTSTSGAHLHLAGAGTGTGEHGALKRLGFLGDMLQLSSAGLLASSSHSHFHLHSHSPGSQHNHSSHSHSHSAASTSLLAASSVTGTGSQRSGAASSATPIPQSLLPARTHSRCDTGLSLDRERAHSPLPSPLGPMAAATSQGNKGHTSPSKAASARTYDSKLVSREMHRLGNLAHLPSLAPSLSATPSSISLNMAPASAPSINTSLSGENPWATLHVLVLPLFNREPLRVHVEDLNQLVKRHIATVVSAAPGRAVATLEHDTADLIASGMVTLNSKLSGVEDDKLVPRVVELWTLFWTQVLPYLEASLLPLQTDSILSSLYRLPKSHRPSSPTSTQNGKGSTSNILLQSTTSQIDVRALALVSFRERIILPLFPRLYARLTLSKDENSFGPESLQAPLQQMLLVLVSQRSHRLASLSLTAPPPDPSPGEAAVARLLRALHAPLTTPAPRHMRMTAGAGAPSFLSAGLPRDRRGRIAQKAELGSSRGPGPGRWRMRAEMDADGGGGNTHDGRGSASVYWDEGETDTPRVGVTFADPGREQDKELLESLRSPDPENAGQMSTGGWVGVREEQDNEGDRYEYEMGGHEEDVDSGAGLGGGEEEMQNLDWDKAQAMVEHMVGMGSKPEVPAQQPQQQSQDTRRVVIEGYNV